MKLVQKSIPQLRSAKIEDIFISATLAEYEDLVLQITEETWPDVVNQIKAVEVTLDEPADLVPGTTSAAVGSSGNAALGRSGAGRGTTTPSVSMSRRAYQCMSSTSFLTFKHPTELMLHRWSCAGQVAPHSQYSFGEATCT
jgi:hypothetical protein